MRSAREALQAFNGLPLQWRDLLPPITVTLTHDQLNRIPALQSAISSECPLWGDEEWSGVYALAPSIGLDEAEVWLRVDPHYKYNKIELHRVFARIILITTPDIHKKVGLFMDGKCETDAAVRATFVYLFTHFILHPAFLRERQPMEWILMQDLDRALLNGSLQRQAGAAQ